MTNITTLVRPPWTAHRVWTEEESVTCDEECTVCCKPVCHDKDLRDVHNTSWAIRIVGGCLGSQRDSAVELTLGKIPRDGGNPDDWATMVCGDCADGIADDHKTPFVELNEAHELTTEIRHHTEFQFDEIDEHADKATKAATKAMTDTLVEKGWTKEAATSATKKAIKSSDINDKLHERLIEWAV